MDVPTLEDCCFSYLIFNLELFRADYLALLPTRMRRKLLFQLPVADVCRLEETAVVEGVDMNLVWKGKCSMLFTVIDGEPILEGEDAEGCLRWYNRIVTPSTRKELRHCHGYKQCCSEFIFASIVYNMVISEAKAMLCHGYPSRSVCVCPPRYSSYESHETVLAMAIQHFHPPTRLSLRKFGDWTDVLLRDPTFVSSIQELECHDSDFLSTSWSSLESLYLNEYSPSSNNDILKSLIPQLKSLHILPIYWSQSGFKKIIDMFLITPSRKQQELRFFYNSDGKARSWSFSITNKVVFIGDDPDWAHTAGFCDHTGSIIKCYPLKHDGLLLPLLNQYSFTRDTHKRKYEDREQ